MFPAPCFLPRFPRLARGGIPPRVRSVEESAVLIGGGVGLWTAPTMPSGGAPALYDTPNGLTPRALPPRAGVFPLAGTGAGLTRPLYAFLRRFLGGSARPSFGVELVAVGGYVFFMFGKNFVAIGCVIFALLGCKFFTVGYSVFLSFF